MMLERAVQKDWQSQREGDSSRGWFSFIRSAILAGFESYGAAQIGIPPLSQRRGDAEVTSPATASAKAADAGISNHTVAEVRLDPVSGIRSRMGGVAAWSRA
jgi:hypothetical protein